MSACELLMERGHYGAGASAEQQTGVQKVGVSELEESCIEQSMGGI